MSKMCKLPKFYPKPKLFQKTVPKIALKFVIYSRGYISAEKPQNNLDMAKAEKGQNNEKDPHFKKSSGTFAGRSNAGGNGDGGESNSLSYGLYSWYGVDNNGVSALRNVSDMTDFATLTYNSLAVDRSIIMYTNTEKLSYYKGTRYTHYIVVDYIDRSRLQVETADCCWTEAYRGHFMVAMDEAYNATKGNYMICLSQQIS